MRAVDCSFSPTRIRCGNPEAALGVAGSAGVASSCEYVPTANNKIDSVRASAKLSRRIFWLLGDGWEFDAYAEVYPPNQQAASGKGLLLLRKLKIVDSGEKKNAGARGLRHPPSATP